MKNYATEDNEMLVRLLVSAVGHDYKQDYKPHIYPNFSDDTVELWEEVERRMKAPVCLEFDREGFLTEIREEISKQSDILAGGPDYDTSYHVGVRSGLNLALRIAEKHIKESDQECRQ